MVKYVLKCVRGRHEHLSRKSKPAIDRDLDSVSNEVDTHIDAHVVGMTSALEGTCGT